MPHLLLCIYLSLNSKIISKKAFFLCLWLVGSLLWSSQKVKFQFPVCEIPLTSLHTYFSTFEQYVCVSSCSCSGFGKNNAIKLSKVHMKPMRISVQISIIPHAPSYQSLELLFMSRLLRIWKKIESFSVEQPGYDNLLLQQRKSTICYSKPCH